MSNKNFQTFFDCGSSKIRAGIFNKNNKDEFFYDESEFFLDQNNLELKVQNKYSVTFDDSMIITGVNSPVKPLFSWGNSGLIYLSICNSF